MRCRKGRYIRRSKTVFRSAKDRVFGGVCGGLGEHFGVNSNWIRAGFVVGTLITSGVAPILYIVCLFIMPREDRVVLTDSESFPPPIPDVQPRQSRFRSQTEAFDYLTAQFDAIENKIRTMEDHVTSKEYVLKRKFESL